MSDKTQESTRDQQVVDKAKDFWSKYSRPLMVASTVIILGAAGYFGYKYLVQEPNEKKSVEAMFKAEDYYRMDSLNLALNGDGVNSGFLKVIDKYGGTKAGNLAHFYAGDIYLKLGDYSNAVKHLEDFGTSSKMIQARAYKLTADAYAGLNKNEDALKSYKKAAYHFEEDNVNSPDYLFLAAYYAQKVMNNNKEAIDLFKDLKQKYPQSQQGFEADKYLAQLGVYTVK
ncbi:MAG: tetratricopeptide repeat protein [Chitinophagaceae bacterium]|jgi:predicted negative regulator of RcsB-dependent stress response|nr:tetratricopeptide repeat protein [Chitinophagaceae bacterium]